LTPIGIVKTEAKGKEVRDKKIISKIIIREEYIEALEGIEEFSHLFVIFWLDQIKNKDKKINKVQPRGRKDLEFIGIFATRTPFRPNPIGLTCVKLINKRNNVLRVQGLDAYNDTPILDIKPFDSWDTIKEFKVPNWWKKLEKEKE
jgi:tRNA-Thr(GGU) m(6)t(6)A37 methyltransferase TsaA